MKWPQGWREVALGQVCSLGSGDSAPQGEEWFAEEGEPFVRTSDVSANVDSIYLTVTRDKLSKTAIEKLRLRRWPKDSLLFPKSGASALLNHRCLLGCDAYVVSHLAILVPNELIEPEFLYWWSKSFDAARVIPDPSYPAIRLEDLARVKLPLPPLPEQQRIVEVLREADLPPFYEAADKAKAVREALVAAALSRKLTAAWQGSDSNEIREASLRRNALLGIESQTSSHEWPTVPLLAVCELNPKLHADERPAADALVTFVPMAAVDEHLAAITTPEVRPYAEVQKGYTAFAEGDVLFAKVTPCMENGKAAVASNLMGCVGFGSTEFHVLRPDTRLILAEYLLHFVRQPQFREQAKAAFVGTGGLQRVPSDFFKRVRLPLPSIPEQRRIVDALKQVAPQPFHSVISMAKRLQSALIVEALSGRLTAAWRQQNAERLAAAARERDARLGAPPAKITLQISEHTAAERRTDLNRPRRLALIEQLSSFQHEVWNTLRHEWRCAVLADDPAAFDEFCTSPQTAWRLEGFAAGREEVRRALEQLAAMGLIRKMSLPRVNANTGRTEYLTAFRPLREAEDGGRAEEDTALADAERLVRELDRRRAAGTR